MMGSAATEAAALRRAQNAAFRAQQQQVKIDKARAKLDAFIARDAAKTGKILANTTIKLQRSDTESAQLLAPLDTQAEIDTLDADARAKFVRALPWFLGGALVIGGIVFLRRRSRKG